MKTIAALLCCIPFFTFASTEEITLMPNDVKTIQVSYSTTDYIQRVNSLLGQLSQTIQLSTNSDAYTFTLSDGLTKSKSFSAVSIDMYSLLASLYSDEYLKTLDHYFVQNNVSVNPYNEFEGVVSGALFQLFPDKSVGELLENGNYIFNHVGENIVFENIDVTNRLKLEVSTRLNVGLLEKDLLTQNEYEKYKNKTIICFHNFVGAGGDFTWMKRNNVEGLSVANNKDIDYKVALSHGIEITILLPQFPDASVAYYDYAVSSAINKFGTEINRVHLSKLTELSPSAIIPDRIGTAAFSQKSSLHKSGLAKRTEGLNSASDIGSEIKDNTINDLGAIAQYAIPPLIKDGSFEDMVEKIELEFTLVDFEAGIHAKFNPMTIRNLGAMKTGNDKLFSSYGDLSFLNSSLKMDETEFAFTGHNEKYNGVEDAFSLIGFLGATSLDAYGDAVTMNSMKVQCGVDFAAGIELGRNEYGNMVLMLEADAEVNCTVDGKVSMKYTWKPSSRFYKFLTAQLKAKMIENGEQISTDKYVFLPMFMFDKFNGPSFGGLGKINLPQLKLHVKNVIPQIDFDAVKNRLHNIHPSWFLGADGNLSFSNLAGHLGIDLSELHIEIGFLDELELGYGTIQWPSAYFPWEYALNNLNMLMPEFGENRTVGVYLKFFDKLTMTELGDFKFNYSRPPAQTAEDGYYSPFERRGKIIVTERCLRNSEGGYVAPGTYVASYKCALFPAKQEQPLNSFSHEYVFDGIRSNTGFYIEDYMLTECRKGYSYTHIGGEFGMFETFYFKGENSPFDDVRGALYDASGKTVLHWLDPQEHPVERHLQKAVYTYSGTTCGINCVPDEPMPSYQIPERVENSSEFIDYINSLPDPEVTITLCVQEPGTNTVSLYGTVKNAKHLSVDGEMYEFDVTEMNQSVDFRIDRHYTEFDFNARIPIEAENLKETTTTTIVNPLPYIEIRDVEDNHIAYHFYINDALQVVGNNEKLIISGHHNAVDDVVIPMGVTIELLETGAIELGTHTFTLEGEIIGDKKTITINNIPYETVLNARELMPCLNLLLLD